MRIALFGISCVGKSAIGKELADLMDCEFVDFDDEVATRMGMSVSQLWGTCFNGHEYRKKVRHILQKVLREHPCNIVIAMPSDGLFHEYKSAFDEHSDITTITLKDKATNIMNRLVFYDDDDNIVDKEFVTDENCHRYLQGIRDDAQYFYPTLQKAKLQFDIGGKGIDEAALALADLIERYSKGEAVEGQTKRKQAPRKKVSDCFYDHYQVLGDFSRSDTLRVLPDGSREVVSTDTFVGADDGYAAYLIFALDEKSDFTGNPIWEGNDWQECVDIMKQLDKDLKKRKLHQPLVKRFA